MKEKVWIVFKNILIVYASEMAEGEYLLCMYIVHCTVPRTHQISFPIKTKKNTTRSYVGANTWKPDNGNNPDSTMVHSMETSLVLL